MTRTLMTTWRICATLAALVLAAPVHAAERFGEGLLWRVEGKQSPASHVFGTIHLAEPRVTTLPPAVAQEFKRSSSLTIEAGVDSSNLAGLASRMLFTDGRSLPGVAGDELFRRAVAVSGSLGLPEPALRIFKPWAVALLLSVPPQDPANVLDFVLARTALEQGKTVQELESLDEQVTVFESMTEADQVELLRQAVDSFEKMPVMIGRLVEVYLARDLAAMWRISQESAGGSAEAKRLNAVFASKLIFDRNARMAERMERLLGEGGAFIAIGALHLYGDRGVLALLERRGYRVTRVY